MLTQSLVFERVYTAPIESVWLAITNKQQMKEWYFDVSDFKPEVGFPFYFYGESNGVKFRHECVVTEVEAPTKLSYTWRYLGYTGQSLVSFELLSLDKNKTKLRLTHSGTDTFPAEHPDFATANFSAGWNAILGNSLLNFVEKDNFNRSIKVNATAAAIWKVIMKPDHQWAKAFGDGALAVTDWKQGSEIVWTDATGGLGARGIIADLQPEKLLHMQYYDDVEPAPGTKPGDYWEKIEIEEVPGSEAVVHIRIEGLQKKYIDKHSAMWAKALELIKDYAEGAR